MFLVVNTSSINTACVFIIIKQAHVRYVEMNVGKKMSMWELKNKPHWLELFSSRGGQHI